MGLDTAQLRATIPLAGLLEMRLVSADPRDVKLEMSWGKDKCTVAGALHGGALMALADTAGAVCAFLNLPEGAAGTTTIESKSNLLAAVHKGTVSAEATALRAGRTLIVVETEVRDQASELVAKTIQTQAVLRRTLDDSRD